MNPDIYDADYYDRGVETGRSCYRNYRWIPELTCAMAMTIIDHLNLKRGARVLDYGCAKGYLVKALRLLGRDAYGVDISKYAIEHVDTDVRPYCALIDGKYRWCEKFDVCIAKDVFEHIPEGHIGKTLLGINADRMFVIVPLGDDGVFRAPANNCDVTHVTCYDQWWWHEMFESNGWSVNQFSLRMDGIKDGYYAVCPDAHGFFTLTNKRGK